MEKWPTLPAHIRLAVLALAEISPPSPPSPPTPANDDLDRLPWEKKPAGKAE